MAKRSRESLAVVGLDLGDRWTRWCRCDERGKTLGEGKVRTCRGAFSRQFAGSPGVRFFLETGTHALWVARELRSAGHEAHVLHARSLRLITQSRRKSDRVDARRLAQLGATTTLEALHTVDVMSEPVQRDRAVLLARDTLVRARARLVGHVRGVTKAWGVQLGTATTAHFAVKMRERIPEPLQAALGPVLDVILQMSETIDGYDQQLERLARESYPDTRRLTQVPGVGTLTALTYLWTIRDPHRFTSSRQVGAYVGLTPGSRRSGNRDPQLRISKEGNSLLRRLLVQGAHHLLARPACDGTLRRFGLQLAARGGKRGKKCAVVAVARKLAVLLHHLWKTGEAYEPMRGAMPPHELAA